MGCNQVGFAVVVVVVVVGGGGAAVFVLVGIYNLLSIHLFLTNLYGLTMGHWGACPNVYW